MAQKSTTALTSRPLTKALGTASILGLAIAGANMANALQTDFGVDYKAQGFAVSSEAFGDAGAHSDTDTGFAHVMRVKANFKHEGTGVSVHTSTELAGDRWVGDNHGAQTSPTGAYNNGSSGDNVRLDTAYVQVPLANGTLLRVGRQAANWSNCFLTCDDRRDRISTITPTSIGTLIALYDRRQDTQSFTNPDNGDQVVLGLVTRLAGFTTGLLYVQWLENTDEVFYDGDGNGSNDRYGQQGTSLFSPYISGMIADTVKLDVGVNYFTGNAVDVGNGQVFADNSIGAYLRAGMDIGPINLQAQWAGTQDGGFIVDGFDSFSSLINNNPDSTQNPTSLYRMGGAFGLEDHSENLIIAKAGFNVTPNLMMHASVGTLMIDNGNDDDSSMVYDLGANYKINDAVSTGFTWGMLSKNDVGTTSGNGLVPGAGGVSFADEDLMAASVNLNVKF